MKEKDILNYLKNKNRSFEDISYAFAIDEKSLNNILKDLINDNKIFLNDDNMYSLFDDNTLSIDEIDLKILNIIKENRIRNIKDFKKYTNLKEKNIEESIERLSNDDKILFSSFSRQYEILYTSKIDVKDKGYGFVKDDLEEEYHINNDFLFGAYNNDLVSFYKLPYSGGKLNEAAVYKIIERAHKNIIGILKIKKSKNGDKYYIKSSQLDFQINAYVLPKDLILEGLGKLCYAKLRYCKGAYFEAYDLKVLGHKDDPGIEILSYIYQYGFDVEFSIDTIESLKYVKDYVEEKDIKDRLDLRDKNIITIDGDYSKDFDDAVDLEILPNGNYLLGVHIADVSHYVTENSPLDLDAKSRGTSLYLADRVVPMLPRELSNGICSLNPGVDRLTLSCIMEYNNKGKLLNYNICESVINSHHRMTYNDVNKILNGDEELINKYKDIYEMLLNMQQFSKILRKLREKKGALEFYENEYEFNLNEDGSPKEIVKRERFDAEKLIEDFMLAANQTVAYQMNISNLPILYRIHEKPDQEKLLDTLLILKNMGIEISMKKELERFDIQKILKDIKGNPFEEVMSDLILRSMMKAKYSKFCLGHYALAMPYYCHFTSPIRRYPDLFVHRMVKKLLLHPGDDYLKDITYYDSIAYELAGCCSDSEKRSVDLERAVDDMLYAWYMEKYVGDSFVGEITSITPFGMFVTIDHGIEGVIMYRNIPRYITFDDRKMCAKDGNKTYHLGDKVNVVCVSASRKSSEIDFVFKEDYKVGLDYENYSE